MARFTEAEKKRLLSNRFIEKISSSHVTFTAEFKVHAVNESLKGKSPSKIFSEAGIDESLFLEDFAKKSISRWKKVYFKDGAKGFESERRGRSSVGRPLKKFDPTDLESVLDRLAYLEAENDLLKKLHALEAESLKKKGSH